MDQSIIVEDGLVKFFRLEDVDDLAALIETLVQDFRLRRTYPEKSTKVSQRAEYLQLVGRLAKRSGNCA